MNRNITTTFKLDSPKLKKIVGIILVWSLLSTTLFSSGNAQDENKWTTHYNLSRSGSSRDPAIVSDGNGTVYSLWLDVFDGYKYSMGDGQSWTEPESMQILEITESVPSKAIFLHDQLDKIYMFWLNEENILFYSFSKVQADKTLGGWSSRSLISINVADFAVTTDTKRNIHIVFQLGKDTQVREAGIYYIKNSPEGANIFFSPLDKSPYYRSLTISAIPREQISLEHATVSITTLKDGQNQIVAASWNNPQIKQLYFSQSINSGSSWEPTTVLASPELNLSESTPENPYLFSLESSFLLIWSSNNENASCMQMYQIYDLKGATWSEQNKLYEDRGVCAESNALLTGSGNQTLLFSDFVSEVAFSVWTGQVYLPPQFQTDAVQFISSEDLEIIQTECHSVVWEGDQLFLIGCQTNGKKDIWVSSRPTDTLLNADEALKSWTSPALLSVRQSQIETLRLISETQSGKLNAFWSESDGNLPGGVSNSIYSMDWDNPQSVEPSKIFSSSSEKVNQPSIILDRLNQKNIVWSGGNSGELYYSWSSVPQPRTPLDWYSPVKIPTLNLPSTQPMIQIGEDGTIFVAYLVPFNEKRGVYVTKSSDQGKNWSEPVRVYDAVSEECEMVDKLSFVLSPSNVLHLSWVCSTIPGGVGVNSFLYARSEDHGATWIDGQRDDDRKVIWGNIISATPENLHLVWQEFSQGRLGFFERVSNDDGRSWSSPKGIAFSGTRQSQVALTVDRAGRLYLLSFEQDGENVKLTYWIRNNDEWQNGKSINLAQTNLDEIEEIAAAVVPDGHLVVIYSLRAYEKFSGTPMHRLYTTSIPIDLPQAIGPIATDQPSATPEEQSTQIYEDSTTKTPESTPTETISIQYEGNANPSITTSMVVIIVGGLTLFLIGLALVVQWMRKTRGL
jgi:hypothetical protein